MTNNSDDLELRIQKLKSESLPTESPPAASRDDSGLGSAYELIATPLVCGGMGLGLDHMLSTSPLCFMVLGILGVCAAFWRLYKTSQGIVTPLDTKHSYGGLPTAQKPAMKSAISDENQDN